MTWQSVMFLFYVITEKKTPQQTILKCLVQIAEQFYILNSVFAFFPCYLLCCNREEGIVGVGCVYKPTDYFFYNHVLYFFFRLFRS